MRYTLALLLCVTISAIILAFWVYTANQDSDDPFRQPSMRTTAQAFTQPSQTNDKMRMNAIAYIQNETWKTDGAPLAPSSLLQEHVRHLGKAQSQSIPWLLDARRSVDSGEMAEAANVMIEGLKCDRAYLSFLSDDIDSVAFGLVNQLIASENHDLARDLISACSVASGDPVAYMRGLLSRLPEESIRSLWEGDPHVTLARFDSDQYLNGMWLMADFQDRETLEWSLDPETGLKEKGSVRIDTGASGRDGETVVGWRDHPQLRLSPGEASIRLYVRPERPEPLEALLSCRGQFGNGKWFGAVLRMPVPKLNADGWLCFDTATIGADLFDAAIEAYGWDNPWVMDEINPEALQKTQLFLANIGISIMPGTGNRYWVDRAELIIPYGSWERQPRIAHPKRFMHAWRPSQQVATQEEATDEQLEQMAELQAMGYIGAVSAAPDVSGVTIHTEGKAHPGVNFIVDGSTDELKLMDMSGHMLHTWRPQPDDPAWPAEDIPMAVREGIEFRRAHLYPNGDVLAIYASRFIIRLDKDSNIRWVKAGGYHHDLRIMDDGTIYVLYREWESVPLANYGDSTLVDYVMIMDEDGNELRRVSVLKALERSHHAPKLARLNYRGDILHTNSIQVMDGQLADRIPAFKKGNVLVCIPTADMIAVIDMETETVTWALNGMWTFPHDPKLLPNDNMLIFDNAGPAWHWILPKASRIVEFDPITQEVVWEYTGSRERPFYSGVCGAAWLLPNDNVLISETITGRVLEVTRGKEIVWEYINTERSGDNDELIGVIHELIRYPIDYADAWLERAQ
jgi:hypothetical protein